MDYLESGEAGVGSLLMAEDDLPRDKFGHPWQASFCFDAQGRPTRLLTDEEGRPLGVRNNAEGNPLRDIGFVVLPQPVAVAARRWFEAHRAAPNA